MPKKKLARPLGHDKASSARQAVHQFLTTLPPAMRAPAWQAFQAQPPCLLCRGPFYVLGVFLPASPDRWGLAPGYQGGCVYGLCRWCVALPEKDVQVEAVLWYERQRQATAPWN
jgi:hypothetical protein